MQRNFFFFSNVEGINPFSKNSCFRILTGHLPAIRQSPQTRKAANKRALKKIRKNPFIQVSLTDS